MIEFYEQHMLIDQIIASYSPKSKKVRERKKRILLDMVNDMLTSLVFIK